MFFRFCFFVCCLLWGTMISAREEASLVLLNGNIWTGNPNQPRAQAIAVSGDKIIGVGSNEEIKAFIGADTIQINGKGTFVTPGFIDSHIHMFTGGFGLTSVQLRDASSRNEFVSRIAAYAKNLENGVWISEGNWDHQNWGGELPTRDWIDSVTPNNPVAIQRLDGHMILANTAALELAGVNKNTPDVAGGEIVRFPDGRPTGILKDDAMALVFRVMRRGGPEVYDQAMEAAMKYLNSHGVTSAHFMSLDVRNEIPALVRARQRNRMTVRVYANMRLRNWEYLRDFVDENGRGDAILKFGGLKEFVDGSLGSHTAAFFQPYEDTPGEVGLLVNTEADLYRWTRDADRAGFQVMIHGIGDRAVNTVLNVFERVGRENGPRDRRFRVEHAQHLASGDMARFKTIGVIPSMQPYHAIDDGRWAEQVIGADRAERTYAFRSLLDAGAVPAFGSDWPVAPASVIMGIYAATSRRTLDEKHPNGWVPKQKISAEETLKGYTVNAAYASFEDHLKGSLEPGKLADFVLLNGNLLTLQPEALREVSVLATIMGGRVVWRNRKVTDLETGTLKIESK